jgi:hypothetical protein
MLRRALAAAAPVTMAGVLQLTLVTTASAAVPGGASVQQPAGLAGLLRSVQLQPTDAVFPSAGGVTSGTPQTALTDLALGRVAGISLLGSGQSGTAGRDVASVSLLDGALGLALLHSGSDSTGGTVATASGTLVGQLGGLAAIPVSIPGVLGLALLRAEFADAPGAVTPAAGTTAGSVTALPLIGAGTAVSRPGGSTATIPAAVAAAPASSTASVSPPIGLAVMPNPRAVPQTDSMVGVAGLALVLAGTLLGAATGLRRRLRPSAG